MYKFLLWDIDGTILDFLASEAYAIRFLFKKYNIGECSDDMLELYSKINVKYWQMLERNELSKSEILVGRFREFFGNIGADVTIAYHEQALPEHGAGDPEGGRHGNGGHIHRAGLSRHDGVHAGHGDVRYLPEEDGYGKRDEGAGFREAEIPEHE